MWLFKDLIEPLNQEMQESIKNKIIYLATGSQGELMGAMNRIINGVHPEVFFEEWRLCNFFIKNYSRK